MWTTSSLRSFLQLGFFSLLFITVASDDQITLETSLGTIVGVRETSRNGAEYQSFFGIPFAKPPLGHLRFRPPEPVDEKWQDDVLNATSFKSRCFQNKYNDPIQVEGSENCLYLNVFTKNSSGALPVIVFIHGGAFVYGGPERYQPVYFMDRDIVFVSLTYRMNIFGFLSTEDGAAPGNYGLWDQIEALRWVKKHISDFGGDPHDVTLFGYSAGGSSVHYINMSPKAKGLFNRAVAMSGSALSWWSDVPHPLRTARTVAEVVGCKTESSEAMIECLRMAPAVDLIKAHSAVYEFIPTDHGREPMNAFSPRSDPESANSVLPLTPIQMMEGKSLNAPMIIGFTSMEGIWRGNMFIPDEPNHVVWRKYVEQFEEVAQYSFGLHSTTDKSKIQTVLANTREFYKLSNLNQSALTEETVENFIAVLSDSAFIYPIVTSAQRHEAAGDDGRLYMFNHSTAQTFASFGRKGLREPPFEIMRGPSHCSDSILLFPMFPEVFGPLSTRDTAVSQKLVDFVVNFGSTEETSGWGKPNENYLVMNDEMSVVRGNPFQERMNFWKEQRAFWNEGRGKDEL